MYQSLLTSPGGLFGELERLQCEFDRSFGGLGMPTSIRALARGAYPAINVGNTPESVEIYAFAPGLEREQLDVSVDKGLLTISGECAGELPEGRNGQTLYANERFSGRFKRVVSLPDDADPARVDATYVDGILHICVKKRETVQPKRIQVR